MKAFSTDTCLQINSQLLELRFIWQLDKRFTLKKIKPNKMFFFQILLQFASRNIIVIHYILLILL